MRQLLQEDDFILQADAQGRQVRAFRVRTDCAIFYSGTSKVLEQFIEHLKRAPGNRYPEPMNLERLKAGKFLVQQTEEFLAKELAWEAEPKLFVGHDVCFKASIEGFWRELSARYARLVKGEVHVLLSDERRHVADLGKAFWELRKQHRDADRVDWKHIWKQVTGRDLQGQANPVTQILNEIRVWGFVEFPILYGDLSKNSGITLINVYVPLPPTSLERFGKVSVLRPGQPM